jgi:hypothetical protein
MMLSPAPDIQTIVNETARWFAERKLFLTWDEGPRQETNAAREAALVEYVRRVGSGAAEQWLADMERETLDGTADWDLELRTIGAAYVADGLPVPAVLRRYVRKVLHGTFPPAPIAKPHKGSYFSRDPLIVDRIKFIERKYGIAYTANEASETHSCCSIVAAALAEVGMARSVEAVKTVWKNRPR